MLLNISGGVGLLIAAIIVAVVAGPKYLSRRPASEIPLERPAASVLPLVAPVRPGTVHP
jgi:hypothetical protein